jgi:hypothetical protein
LKWFPQHPANGLHEASGWKNLRKEVKQMTYESFELVELGGAEMVIESVVGGVDEETLDKFDPFCAPYVEYDE